MARYCAADCIILRPAFLLTGMQLPQDNIPWHTSVPKAHDLLLNADRDILTSLASSPPGDHHGRMGAAGHFGIVATPG